MYINLKYAKIRKKGFAFCGKQVAVLTVHQTVIHCFSFESLSIYAPKTKDTHCRRCLSLLAERELCHSYAQLYLFLKSAVYKVPPIWPYGFGCATRCRPYWIPTYHLPFVVWLFNHVCWAFIKSVKFIAMQKRRCFIFFKWT